MPVQRLDAVDEDELVRELVRRVGSAGREQATELIAKLVDGLHAKAAGRLSTALVPTRELDYGRDRIELVVSSPAIAKRLGSVAKEPFTVEWIEQNVKAGDVFYDIGANVGPYSLIAAKATQGRARIFAFEPAPASFRDLAQNVALNECDDCVTPLPLALWSETTMLQASWSSPHAGAARHRLAGADGSTASMVVALRLDDLVSLFDLPLPSHAKIDVDGSELEVLRGAPNTLASPTWQSIIIELDPGETDRNREIGGLLAAAGFDDGVRHDRVASRRYPDPDERPDVYWTFTRTGRASAA